MSGDGDAMRESSTSARTGCARRSRTSRTEFSAVRTGRATPALVEKLKVDYYGSEVPLQQLAGFGGARAAGARDLALRQGRDRRDREGDPAERPRGQPANDGQVIRLDVPRAHRGAPQGAREGRASTGPRRAGSRCATSAATPATSSRRSRRTASSRKDDLDRIEKDLEKATHEVVAEIDEHAWSTRSRSCSRYDVGGPDGRAADATHGAGAGAALHMTWGVPTAERRMRPMGQEQELLSI